MALSKTDVAKLYVAMFNRAPEGQGLDDWYNAAVENNWDLGALAQSMLNAAQQVVASDPSYQSIYPQYVNVDTSSADSVRPIIEEVYKILFNKDYNTDPSGIDGWVNSVVKDGEPLGNVIASITLAAEQIANDPNADADAKAAAQAFENKVQVALYSAELIPSADLDGDGKLDFQTFQDFVKNVTDDTSSVTTVKTEIEAVAPSKTVVLTPGMDDVTANIIYGSETRYLTDGTGPTLNPGDKLHGEPNRDDNKLIITDLTAGAAQDNIPAGVILDNIQTVELRSSGNTAGGTGFSTVGYGDVEHLIGETNGGGNDVFSASNEKTDVNVMHNGYTGNLTVVGGTDVTATTVGGNIQIGNPILGSVPLDTQIATGKVVVNQMFTGAGAVNVMGGTDVEVNVTSNSNTGNIDIGNTAANTGNIPAGKIANPKGNVTVKEAGIGNVTVFGGKDVTVTDTALKGAGAITVGDITYVDPSNLPSGNVTVKETASIAYDGLAGSSHNNVFSGNISIFGGKDISVETNASNNIVIGNLNPGVKEDALNPTGTISVTNTGVTTAGAPANIAITGGTDVEVTTTGGNVIIGRAGNAAAIDSASNPTGNVTVTETMNGAKLGVKTVTIDGGADVTVNAKGQNVAIGTSADSAPTGAVVVNQSDEFTGNAAVLNTTAAGNVVVDGGTDVTVNTTGGNVIVGGVVSGKNVVPSGAVSITNTFSGAGADNISVQGGTTVDITTTMTKGNITVGNGSAALNATGTALKDADLAPTGDVTIVDATTAGDKSVYGTGNVNVNTNGAENVSIKGGDVDTVADIQSTLQTGGANAGKAVGTSTLKSVVLDGNQSTDGVAINSDVLTELSILNTKATDIITITNNTADHDLTITQGGNTDKTNTITVIDAKAGTVTVKDNGKDSTSTLKLQAAKATSLTVDNAAAATLNIGSVATDLATVTLKGAGNTTFATTDVFGAGNLSKVTTIDASEATGNVTASFQAKTDNTTQKYIGSKGVDTLTITSNPSGWGTNVSVNGGDGDADTVIANYAAAATDVALGNAASVKGFEKLGLGTLANGAYDASGFDEVKVGNVAGNITINNAASGATLSVTKDTTGGKTITFNGANNTSTNDKMTVNLGSDTNNITAPTTGAITANEIEKLTVNSTGGKAGNTVIINDIASNGQAELTITGDKKLTLTSNAGFTKVDATAAKGDVNINAAALSNQGVTIEGGEGKLTATGSNNTAVEEVLVTLTPNGTAPDISATQTVAVTITDGTNKVTYTYTAPAGGATVKDAMSELATAITTGASANVTVAAASGTAAALAGNLNTVQASGGNLVIIGNAGVTFEVQSAETATNSTISQSLLGGQQQDVITVTTAATEAGDKLSVDINGTTVTYTATGADTKNDTAVGLANAIKAAGIADIANAYAVNDKVFIISQIGKSNIIDNVAGTDKAGGDGTAPAATAPVESINMTTVSNLVKSGSGGIDYKLGLGGSWDNVTNKFGSGSETIDLTASKDAVDTLRLNDGAVSTFNGANGGVTNFVVDSQNASDVLTFATAGKTIVANAVTNTVANVNNANTMANVLDPSGSLASKLANLTYTIKNGVVTFGATGGHSLSEFTSGDLISAAEILVSSTTTGGANKVLAFSANGHSYVVASDGANTLNGGTNNNSIIVDLKDVSNVEGFGSTFGEGTIVSTNVTTLSNTAITSLNASQTQDSDGKFAQATITAAGSAAVNTAVTNLDNLASSAIIKVTNTGAAASAHMGSINVTQVGADGHNSLTASVAANTTIDTLTVNGDAEVFFKAANQNTSVISSLVDATNTMNTVTINGAGGMLTSVTSNALEKIDATNATGAFYFGVNAITLGANTATADAHNNLTIDLADNQAALVNVSGSNVTITQNSKTTTGIGNVTIKATGSNTTIDLDDGNNVITANGANDTISVGKGVNIIVATGSDDVINVDSGAATTITVGANATVNLGNANAAGAPIADLAGGTDTIKVGSAVTGGDSSNFSHTVISILDGTHNAANDVAIDLNDTATIAASLLGASMAASQINVSEAKDLAEALDMAANYTELTQAQGTAATTANLPANTAKIDWFWYDGNTYIVEMVNDSAAAVQQDGLDANDIVVEIEGLHDLSVATFNAADAILF